MSFFDGFKKSAISYVAETEVVQINIDEIIEGSSQNDNFLFHRNGEAIKIFDRVCDHTGGRLSLKGEKASCPLHGWELDLEAGRYINVTCNKEPLLFLNTQQFDSPFIEIPIKKTTLETLKFDTRRETTICYLNHACLHFVIDNHLTFATDPWVIGSAFSNGWWLAKDSPSDVFRTLNKCDFIYISHNHPDHLHPKSLEHIRKDMPILTAGFITNSAVSMLEQSGFTDITVMDFSSRFINEESEFSIAVLKSGDFRDDSGLLVEVGEFKCLLTVDSNQLNFGKLPSVDLLCSSFAGGASGFPLCFDNYSEQEKKSIVTRNRSSIRAAKIKDIQLTTPHYFMPYAGFFTEKAHRDKYVKENNLKNSVEDFQQICTANKCELLNVNENQIFKFEGKELTSHSVDISDRYIDKKVDDYLSDFPQVCEVEFTRILTAYFEGSDYEDNLELDLIATDESFSQRYERFNINFTEQKISYIDEKIETEDLKIKALSNGNRFLQIKVRREELIGIILNRRPWEDLSIGFQCRVYRKPNVYNSEFWYYFTNVYIGKNVEDLSVLLD